MAQLKSGSIIIGRGTILDSDNISVTVQPYNAHTVVDSAYVHTDNNYTTVEKTKLSGIAENANNYAHPTGDGNLHVPATGTTNDGNVLKAGPTAGSLVWAPDNDTIYEHPANHPPSIITQDASNRFVTDVQIAAWNSKAEGDHTHPELHTHSNKTVLDGLTDSAGELLYNGSQIAPELAGTTWGDLIPIV